MRVSLIGLLIILLAIQQSHSIIPAYDILGEVSDIDHDDLVKQVSRSLNTTHLGLFTGQIQTTYKGVLSGPYYRPMISLPVKSLPQSCPMINVIFKVEPGAGRSSISKVTALQLFKLCAGHQAIYHDAHDIMIAGRRIMVIESMSFYKELNILGADFLKLTNSLLSIDYSSKPMGHVQLILSNSKESNSQDSTKCNEM